MVCVLGPTASGKTRYAVQLARELGNAEIISAFPARSTAAWT